MSDTTPMINPHLRRLLIEREIAQMRIQQDQLHDAYLDIEADRGLLERAYKLTDSYDD